MFHIRQFVGRLGHGQIARKTATFVWYDFKKIMNDALIETLLFAGYFGVVLIFLVLFRNKYEHKPSPVLQSFARTHGLRFDAVGSLAGSVGNLFSTGIKKRMMDVVTYKTNNEYWRCFNYQYTQNIGRTAFDSQFTVLEYDVMTQLPNLAIVPAKLDDFGVDVGVPAGYQRLSLEGNFDKRYHAYIIAGSQDSVLEILTPDVMEFLLDAGNIYYLEITGSRFVLSQDEFAKSMEDLEGMLRFAQSLADQIGPVAGRMHYDGAEAAYELADTNARAFVKYTITIGAILLIGGALILAALVWAPALSYQKFG